MVEMLEPNTVLLNAAACMPRCIYERCPSHTWPHEHGAGACLILQFDGVQESLRELLALPGPGPGLLRLPAGPSSAVTLFAQSTASTARLLMWMEACSTDGHINMRSPPHQDTVNAAAHLPQDLARVSQRGCTWVCLREGAPKLRSRSSQ